MAVDSTVFKAYDIRGVYPEQINEENIVDTTHAIYKFFQDKLKKEHVQVALGHDMRISSPKLFPIVRDTLKSIGAHVVDIGLVSTPTFYFAVSNYNYETGIVITASHNPKQYTGMKFVINTPNGLLKIGKPTGMDDIKIMATNSVRVPESEGSLEFKKDIVVDEVKNALDILKNPELKEFKIVADPANAMGITYIEELAKELPINLVKMNFTLDGTFPVHQPDPMQPENLVDAQKKLLEENADLALVPDGDGDRLFIIDEKGEVVSPSIITSMIAKELLSENPGGKIVVDAKYSFGVEKNVKEMGGEVLVSKTGHAFITEKMTQTGALMAGEASAHYYYKATGNAESQVITIVSLFKILTRENRPLSEVAEEYRRSYESGEINFKVTNAQEIMNAVKDRYQDGEFSDLDGIIIRYPDWKMSIRTSNTEPLLRFNLEAYEKDVMEKKRDEIKMIIQSIAKIDESISVH